MSPDPTSLETELRQRHARPLDDALLERLESCVAGTWTQLSRSEAAFEASIRRRQPAPLPPALLASLATTLRQVPFPGDANIVTFPAPAASRAHHPRRHQASWRAAAAAVAILGATTAWFLPGDPPPGPVARHPAPAEHPPTRGSNKPAEPLMPAGYQRGLAEARDEGIIWQSPNERPQRVVKIVYTERVTLKDAAGRTYQIEQPRVHYILVPAKSD